MDFLWKHPFNCIVSAPTKSGKTELVKKLVLFVDEMIQPTPKRILWSYTEWQNGYSDLQAKVHNITFIEGLPNLDDLKAFKNEPQLLILDDMMQEMKSDKRLNELFTRGSHHWNLSIVHIVQNAFFDGMRTSRINAQYLILMKNPADRLQIYNLGRQMFRQSKYFIEAFEDATSQPYGYLLVDLTQSTPENQRLRTHIFPNDRNMVVYTPK